jgi:hypothetical protein
MYRVSYLQEIWTAFLGMRVFSYVKSDAPSYPWGWLLFPALGLDSLSARLQLGRRQSYHLAVFTKSVLPHTVPPIQWLPLGSVFADKNDQGVFNHSPSSTAEARDEWSCNSIPLAFVAYIGTSLP